MKNTLEILIKTLENDERLVVDGELLKNKVIELANKMDTELLKLLKSEKDLKNHFFVEVDDVLVFDKQKFFDFVNNKNFLADSFTKHKNTIGLSNGDNYFSESNEVVLAWPYKDTVLEGGQSKEDAKRNEIFHNEILAPDQIDRLLDPKVFTNFKKFTTDGEQELKGDEDVDFEHENLIIKGNNLIALHSLKRKFAGKVKLIYIDPPYNTGSDGFNYNDRFNHSTWLTFMKNRLEIARDLLSTDGSIWINIDDDESHYLKVVTDDIFGRSNFVGNIIWEKKYSPQNDATYFSDMHDHILVFAKDKQNWDRNLMPRTEEMNSRYTNPDNDKRGDWKSSDFSVKTYSADYDYPIKTPSGRVVNPPKGRSWRTSKDNFNELLKDNRIWFGVNGDAVPSIKRFLSEVQQGTPPKTIWTYQEVGHNQDARNEVKNLFKNEEADFATPKPESLIKRIIHIASNEDDIVLDFFAGSGTTMAVAHKMGRSYIGIEQMAYINNVTVPRLKKVIGSTKKAKGKLLEELEYDDGGISDDVNWKGGGSFVYCEIAEWNESFIEEVKRVKTEKELKSIWQEMQDKSFLSHKVDVKMIDETKSEYEELKFEDKKKFLVETLDKNYLYIPYSEIDDEEFDVSEQDKKLNKKFYKN